MNCRPLAIIVLSTLLACSPGKDLSVAQQQVDRFHEQYNSGQDRQSYDEASPLFHRSVDPQKWMKLRSEIRGKLGRAQSTQRQSFKEWIINRDHMIEVVYQTTFASGVGSEKFTWQLDGANVSLVGYYITLPLS